jgi:UDP-N-acetylglucosamine acyltransferase
MGGVVSDNLIHPTAVIDAKAQLDSTVSVGPYSIIGPNVKIGAGTTVGPHAVIEGHTTIGQDNRVFQFTSLGAMPQDKKYAGEPCELIIGNGNTIREFCTFNIGSPGGGGITRVGDRNWLMAYVHLAHDCIVGNDTIFANNTQLAGHVLVGDFAILGGFTVVHQFVRIGAHSMTAMCSLLFADLPPISAVKAMHKALYRDDLSLEAAVAKINELSASHPEAITDVQMMNGFLAKVSAQRGIVR